MPNIIDALQANNTEAAKKSRKPRSLSSGRFYSAKVLVKDGKAVIVLPKKILDYLDADTNNPEIYWAPINGVIQISGKQPTMVIPMISVTAEEFVTESE